MRTLIFATNIEKTIGDHFQLSFDRFVLCEGDKVGITGRNGAGKTIFLNIITETIAPDKGQIKRYADYSYLKQFETNSQVLDYVITSKEGSEFVGKDKMTWESGGERMRTRLAEFFSNKKSILILDEPTSNLDENAREVLQKHLELFSTYIIVCHDRDILEKYCNRIIDIENGELKQYTGNYSDYVNQKNEAVKRAAFEYEEYSSEKKRLEELYIQQIKEAKSIRKKPKDKGQQIGKEMGPRSKGTQQKSIERRAMHTQSRIAQLEVKKKPKPVPSITMDFSLTSPPKNEYVIRIENLIFNYSDKYADRKLFNEANLLVKNGEKLALIGENGIGKSTLLNLIVERHPSVYIVPNAKIGYFRQGFEQIDENITVLENATKNSVQSISVVRTVLANSLFGACDLGKKASVLSGGERVRLGLVMLILSENNILMLDEPTNYIDMPSRKAIEEILGQYQGTIIFTSHDGYFVRTLATRCVSIQNGRFIECDIEKYFK